MGTWLIVATGVDFKRALLVVWNVNQCGLSDRGGPPRMRGGVGGEEKKGLHVFCLWLQLKRQSRTSVKMKDGSLSPWQTR